MNDLKAELEEKDDTMLKMKQEVYLTFDVATLYSKVATFSAVN